MTEPLLSELCRICHTDPPKYRCPRCSTQTCSLPCTKRHKLWAQCSGIRDPAAYIKRSDLATPAGIDRDFNFLTSIERKLDDAEKDADGRGVQLTDNGDRRASHGPNTGPRKGEVNVQRAIERTGVIVDRAPKGMVRSKENKTHWHRKHKCLSWTVEWIQSDGKRELGNALETLPLTEAYARFRAEKYPPTKKRKLERELAPGPPSATGGPIVKPQSSPCPEPERQPAPAPAPAPAPTPSQDLPVDPEKPPDADSIPTQELSTDQSSSAKPSIAPPLHFYLLRPHTPSSSRVLIPLSPSSPLAELLQHRVILEFPTIYALPQAPYQLPDGYILESEFLGLSKREEEEMDELLAILPAGSLDRGNVVGLDDHADADGGQPNLDDRKILDVLRKDLGAG